MKIQVKVKLSGRARKLSMAGSRLIPELIKATEDACKVTLQILQNQSPIFTGTLKGSETYRRAGIQGMVFVAPASYTGRKNPPSTVQVGKWMEYGWHDRGGGFHKRRFVKPAAIKARPKVLAIYRRAVARVLG